MKRRFTDRVYLVLSEAHLGPVYVDSVWSTADGANGRVTDLYESARAFQMSNKMRLRTLEVRVDVMGLPIKIQFVTPESPNGLGTEVEKQG